LTQKLPYFLTVLHRADRLLATSDFD
jgi:hypothetical protein